MKKLLITLLLVCGSLNAQILTMFVSDGALTYADTAKTYYVDGVGTGDTLETIAEVNALTLNPADQVLFKRGVEWRGETLEIEWSGTEEYPIVFADYGAGDKPIFNGAEIITDWTALDTLSGVESVTNGTFNTNTSGWASGVSLTVDTERLKVTNNATTYGYARQLITTVPDVKYYYSVDIISGSHTTPKLLIGSVETYNAYADTIGTGTLTGSFTATTTGTYFRVDLNTNTDGAFGLFDNFSLEAEGNERNLWVTASPLTDDVWAERTAVIIDDSMFMQVDSLGALDATLEYFPEDSTGVDGDSVYVYSVVDPSTRIAELSTVSYGMNDRSTQGEGTNSNIIIRNLDFRHHGYGGITVFAGGDSTNTNYLIDSCNFYASRQYAVLLYEGASGNTIQNSTASYCGNGFYVARESDNNSFIRNTVTNTISYSGLEGTLQGFTDGHALANYRSKNVLMEYNHIVGRSDDGGGVGLDSADGVIRYNTINVFHSSGLSSNVVAAGDTLEFYYNVVTNDTTSDGNCFGFYTTSGRINYYNNTNIQRGTNVHLGRIYYTPENVYLKNNIYYNGTATTSLVNSVYGGLDFNSDYNVWYNKDDVATYYLGNSYQTLAAWVSASSQDANSVDTDPTFTTEFTDLSLQTGSPAINAGTDVGLTQDILGNPIVGLPDIGAFEKQ